ncbi:translocation/assembly module TamB domain-containing protein [Orbus wheelerorum]|uniref:autotransporter assembly complex protein TamB n=1 Tax=Orbus wheelerorum TaxID=3074111 RepID=UPI00370D4DA4
MANHKRLKKVKRIKRIRKWKKSSLIVLCTFSVLICFLLILIYTSLGIKIITTVLEKVMPEIKIEHATGALNDLNIEGFSMELDGVDVKVGKAALSLSGLCLIEGKICIKNLDAKDITVNIHTDAFPADDSEALEPVQTARSVINMPLPMELRKASLTNVSVNVDDMHFDLSSFNGRATWVNEKIYVFPATAMDVKAIFPDTPTDVEPVKTDANNDNLSISETINQIFNKPLISALPTVNIPLDIYVNSLKGDNWLLHIGGQDYQFNNVTIQASTENNYINARLVQATAKTPYANGDVKVSGNITLGDKWPVSANIDVKTKQQDELGETEISGKITGQLLGKLSAKTQIKGLNQADIDAQIDFVETYMPVTAKISGKAIQWPIFGKAEYQLKNFDLDLSGSVKNYHFNSKGDFYGTGLPSVLFDMKSDGTNESFNIKSISATLPQGEFDLSAKVGWRQALKWDASIDFNKIDLSREIPDYLIKLDGKLKTNGSIDGKSWIVNLNQMQLDGNINKAPLHASGNIAINSSKFISADKFNLSLGNNHIDLNGSTTKSNLIADLKLTDLKVIDPDLKGNITGQVIVNGSIDKPIIKSNLVIDNFVWQDIKLHQGSLTGDIKYSDILAGNIKIQANQFDMPNVTVDNAEILLSGNEQNHHLLINVKGKPVSSAINLNGQLNKQRTEWQGSIADANLTFSPKNSWQINKPINLKYNLDTNQASISAHCWVDNESHICLDKNVIIADRGEANIILSNIDLTLFESINQGETKLAGTIYGKANIKWDPAHKIPTIVASINSNDVYIRQQIASQTLPIPFDLFAINVNINDKQAKLDWKFSTKEFGRFDGNIVVDDPTDNKRLSGQVIIDQLSLSIINPLLNDNEHANGAINANLKFSGTLLDPYITGKFALSHSDIKVSQLPADIQSIVIDIDFKGKSSELKGLMQTKSGNVNINGKADWQNINNWQAFLTVKGAAIEVTIPPMITMSIVPDIRIDANQNELNLVGKVTIPKANIKVESLPPSTVDVSSDEVMLDSNLQEIAPQDLGIKINSRVLVSLGDKVNVDAFGLVARLTGGVYVTQTNKGLTVNGQIFVPDGRFHAYGQDLIVRKGEIVFAGLADQPRLNIEAIRNPESIENNVIAGIRVTGLADDPKVEIFSEPAMSQQEALSYLLRGQGLDSGDQSENDMMTALLIGLGTAQGGQIIGDIGNTFGIKNLSLDTQGVGDSQKVVVSGYILPNLQLKYGIGIFDSLATFTLRYRLLPRLYLEAVSGVDQTVDLIYQFEF